MNGTHELIRYIKPKNHAKDEYMKKRSGEMMNHINSYLAKSERQGLFIDLFIKIHGQETANLLGLEKILIRLHNPTIRLCLRGKN